MVGCLTRVGQPYVGSRRRIDSRCVDSRCAACVGHIHRLWPGHVVAWSCWCVPDRGLSLMDHVHHGGLTSSLTSSDSHRPHPASLAWPRWRVRRLTAAALPWVGSRRVASVSASVASRGSCRLPPTSIALACWQLRRPGGVGGRLAASCLSSITSTASGLVPFASLAWCHSRGCLTAFASQSVGSRRELPVSPVTSSACWLVA
jgi:hypothetical protein